MNTKTLYQERDVSIALIHGPVLNKRGEEVTTSVTNLDIHDIARAAQTYGVSRYFIINPLPSQKRLVDRIVDHWVAGYGMTYNPDRGRALATVSVVEALDDAIGSIVQATGKVPTVVGTSARRGGRTVGYHALRTMIQEDHAPYLLLFGTGWGMTEKVKDLCTYMMEPIRGPGDYQHLSVRSAAAVVLDRLRGRTDERSMS
jgi:hypothetical protein